MPSTLKDIYNHLWALLEASSDFTSAFTERRRIKATSFDARAKIDTYFAGADLPNIRITPGLPGGGKILPKSRTFAADRATFDPATTPLVSQEKYQFQIIVVHKSLTLGGDTDTDALVSLCYGVFLLAGPHLGVQEVDEWSFDRVAYAIKSDGQANGTERMVATIQMPITCLVPVSNYTT